MPEIIWLGTALADLQEIKDFYEEQEVGLGEQLAGVILDIDRILSHHPKIGQVAKNLRPEHRQLIRGHHLILYRVENEVVKIAAVIDSRRDFQTAWRAKPR